MSVDDFFILPFQNWCVSTSLALHPPPPCSVSHVLLGDRGTEAKVVLRRPLLYAHTFHVDGAPGLMAINSGEEGEGPVLEVRKGGGFNRQLR